MLLQRVLPGFVSWIFSVDGVGGSMGRQKRSGPYLSLLTEKSAKVETGENSLMEQIDLQPLDSVCGKYNTGCILSYGG